MSLPREALVARAQSLRKNPTYAEAKLWSRLRRKQLGGLKFRRQHVLEPYIVDFFCHACSLAVEVDGESHDSEDRQEEDRNRTEVLEERHEVKVVRFTSSQVLRNIDTVMEGIRAACE